MEAASIPWRPLGRLLVEQGLLTAGELEHALAQQEQTGQRLGEALVECGFVSGPELSNALAAQYGIELAAETGFGTGLRTEIQRRHETDRGRAIRAVPNLDEPAQSEPGQPEQGQSELEGPSQDEQPLHAQLEEQWAKLAAAEERLAESHRELTSLARAYDRRRGQARRFAQRLEARRRQHDERVAQLERDVHDREAQVAGLRGELEDSRANVAERDRLLQAAEESRHEFAERSAQLERDVHDRDAQLDRTRSELAGASATVAERDRLVEAAEERLVESRRELATRIAQLEGEIGGRDAELDGLREALAGTEAAGAERDRVVEGLRTEAERRRAQAVRFLERARETRSERGERAARLADEIQNSHAEIERFRSQLAVAEATADERDDLLEGLRAEADRRRTQAVRFLERARESRRERDKRDEELTAQRERRRAQLVRFIGRVRERDGHIEQLAADVRGCDAELDRLRNELETRLREQTAPPAPPPPPASHLVFVQLAGRYELAEQAGPPPARNAVVALPELHGGPLVVAGLARSPLPGDVRPCAFVQPV